MPYDEISDLRFFTMLIEAGSVTAAARSMGTSPAVTSRRLSRMEERLGSSLVVRTTRHFRPTETGRVLYERGVQIVSDVDKLEDEIAQANQSPQGSLNIGAPVELGRRQIAPFIETFSEKYPKLSLSLALAGEGLHDSTDCLDVILRLGMPDTPGAIVTLLATTRRVLCAAPSYIERRSLPQTPHDLSKHDCLCLRRHKTMTVLNKWVIGDDEKKDIVTVHSRLSSTSCEIIHDWALSGRGIAYKLLCDVHHDIESGKLARIFPDLYGEKTDLYAVMPSRQHASVNVRTFLHELREFLRNTGGF
ncbi:LysR substrate-binding domain-containing protein [Acetobacter vaccinii]|uniref:LysR family transcriptional regulator n=1 Tax=Acetobacter vaccinii TaxID=2592655 RepID=A0A5C1YKM0_9PROT|nr:LysR substrate-binding domain-containing protein [Acetobacter vaccinii]QEO16796.1 LysR family transcriptional regulator [Acetobacter vaccinii]